MRTPPAHRARALVAALTLALLASAFSSPSAQADQIIYIVQPGDNLFRIGLKYGVSWTAIMQANGLSGPTVHVGQQLVIPSGDVASAPAASAPASAPHPTPTDSGTYVVQRGDTLFSVAQRYSLTTAQLAAANGLSNPRLIYAGQTLTIPGLDSGSSPDPAPPTPLSGGKRIEVNLSQQHLYAYQGDALIFSFVASTGEPGRETWPGSYRVLNKVPNAYAATWNLWMPNWLGIYWAGNLQNGIHALPILSNGQRLWAGYLGTPVSFGCIILGVNEAQTLYDWAQVGTLVDIHY